GAVDLDEIHRKTLEIAKRGVAGAEVVDGQFYSQRPQLLADADGVVDIVQQLALGQFQLQQMRRQPGFLQHLTYQSYEIALAQLLCREISRHPYRRPLQLPLARLPAGLTQDVRAQRNDQPGLFGQRNKVARRQQSLLRMIPAHQRLGRLEPVRSQAQSRLIEQLQLACRDGPTQLVFQLQILQAGNLQTRGKEL